KEAELPPAALHGLKLFVGRASCIDCHSGPMLSDGDFHNIGVPQQGQNVPTEVDCTKGNARCDCVTEGSSTCFPWGWRTGLRILQTKKQFRRDGKYSDNAVAVDPEIKEYYDVPVSDSEKGKWRTPSLRDVG